MSAIEQVSHLFTWTPLAAGSAAPRLSLTADEGTWVKLKDFKGHLNVCLVFFRSMHDDATDAWLKEWQRRRQSFEDLETVIFGINTARTDRLREFRTSLGLEYYLLYDPLALEARGFRASGRVRPLVKDNVVLIGKDGSVVFAGRGQVDPKLVLEQVARLEGADLPVDGAAAAPTSGGFTGVRDPGQAPDKVRDISSTEAERLLTQADSPFKLVDVRTLSEYEADHSPHAVHIPVDELPHRYQELGQTTHIICVCQAGGRSAAAAEFLTSIGSSHIYNVLGGMSGWQGERLTGGKSEH
jgi:rhodanese-related sulfurtransferase/peroxiredoxin